MSDKEREQIEEELTALYMYAGIALPGVIGRTSIFDNPETIAEQAFNIAEIMVKIAKEKKDERYSSIDTKRDS